MQQKPCTIQMKWKEGILIVRSSPTGEQVHYKNCPYALPDYNIPNGSAGFRTMQSLLKLGATYCQDTPNFED